MALLGIEQKKGNPESIDGRLTVYALVTVDPSEMASSSHPIFSMIHNGLLVAQGNYKEQSSLKDFLQSELGTSLDEGLEEFIEKLDGLEGALDPQKLKDKMKNLDDLKDFIPTPAKIVPFHSESEILSQEGDVYYAGTFKNMANANLSVNSFPILYQSRYREQEIDMIRNEIDHLIAQVEHSEIPQTHFLSPGVNIEETINKDYISGLLYAKRDSAAFDKTVTQFKEFLQGYTFTEDIDHIISLIAESEELTQKHSELLELYAKKIELIAQEKFSDADAVSKKITTARRDLSLD